MARKATSRFSKATRRDSRRPRVGHVRRRLFRSLSRRQNLTPARPRRCARAWRDRCIPTDAATRSAAKAAADRGSKHYGCERTTSVSSTRCARGTDNAARDHAEIETYTPPRHSRPSTGCPPAPWRERSDHDPESRSTRATRTSNISKALKRPWSLRGKRSPRP